MTTYGKKRSRLSSFLTFGHLQSATNKKSKKKASHAQMVVHPDSGEAIEGDDGIARMASALLDDSMDHMRDSPQHIPEHLPQVRHSKTTPNLKGDFCSQVFESANGSYNSQSIFGAYKATNRDVNRSLLRESNESTKEIGRMGKGVLTKMKNSVVDLLQGGSPGSGCNSVRDERLLESSSNESQELDEGQSVEKNFEKGNYLKTQPVYKGPEPLWNPLRMHPPNFSMQPPISRIQFGVRMEVDEGADSEMESTLHKYAPKSDLARIPNKLSYPSEFNAILSSSPDGQSTPRVRVEPSLDDSTRSTRKFHGDPHSLPDFRATTAYNLDMDIDEKQFGVKISIEDGLKRKRIPEVLCSPKRTKKHPSPYPEDLKLWGDAMDELKKTNFVSYEDVSLADSVVGYPLSKRDANENLKPVQGPTYPSNAFAKNELHGGASVSNLRIEGLKSTICRQATEKRGDYQSTANRNRSVAVMDVDEEEDELNCNNPNYILTRTRKP